MTSWRREVIGTDLPDLGIHQVMVNSMLEAYPELSGRTQRQAAMAIAERIMADLESGKLPPRLLLEFVQSVTPDADFTTYDVRVKLSTIIFVDAPVEITMIHEGPSFAAYRSPADQPPLISKVENEL